MRSETEIALQARVSPGADLRRVGAHPDRWYAVAWSDDVPQRRVVQREFAGEPIALYRGAAGQIFALEDRCAHRQVPLSKGVVAGEHLRCGYHGWTYDGASGRLMEIPYLDCPGRGPVGVRPYMVREVDGVVFVFPGDPRHAGEPPSGLAHFTDRRYRTRRLDRSVACHYSFCHENLFDMNHQFLHRRLMGSVRAHCLGHRRGEDWCEVEYAFERAKGRGGIGERTILSRFKGPAADATPGRGHALMKIRTEYPYQRLRVFVTGDEPALDVWLCYTPVGRGQGANRTFGYLSVKRPGFAPLLDVMWPFVSWFTEAIFREDKAIMEAEQAAHDAQDADWNREIFPAILELRDVLADCGRSISI